MLAEIRVVVALADELDEGVDRDQRILDLVGDAGDHPGEQLGLFDLPLLRQQLLLRRPILEDEHRTQRRAVFAADGVGGNLEPQATQGELDFVPARRAAGLQRVEEHVA